jgi:hypothetical protein
MRPASFLMIRLILYGKKVVICVNISSEQCIKCSVYNSTVRVWFPESFLCSLWRQVTSRCDKRISSELRQTASLVLCDASTSRHVIDAGGVGEYANVFFCNSCFVVSLILNGIELIWN